MEDWQQKHITQHLTKLINSTEFNSIVKAELLAKNILTQNDIDDLVIYNQKMTTSNLPGF